MYKNPLVFWSMEPTLCCVTVQTAVFITVVVEDKTGNVRINGTLRRSGKEISITYSECVLVALVIQHAMCMHRIVICGLYGSTIYLNIIL
jgi:hypothetical protein